MVVVCGYDYQDEPNSSQEESIEQQKTSNVQEDPKEDITLDNFKFTKRIISCICFDTSLLLLFSWYNTNALIII